MWPIFVFLSRWRNSFGNLRLLMKRSEGLVELCMWKRGMITERVIYVSTRKIVLHRDTPTLCSLWEKWRSLSSPLYFLSDLLCTHLQWGEICSPWMKVIFLAWPNTKKWRRQILGEAAQLYLHWLPSTFCSNEVSRAKIQWKHKKNYLPLLSGLSVQVCKARVIVEKLRVTGL